MTRIPLLIPIGVRLTPAVLYAMMTHLDDAVSADRFEACLQAQGVDADASEEVIEAMHFEIHRALGSAHERPGARRVQAKVFPRTVVAHGCVWIAGRPYGHPDLEAHVGDMVKCVFTEWEGLPAAGVTDFNDAPICIATVEHGLEHYGAALEERQAA